MVDASDFITLAIVMAFLGIVLTAVRLGTEDRRLDQLARMLSAGLFLVTTGLMLYMYYLFITTDVSFEYVWEFTKEGASLKYRLSGTIGGLEGSLLFWIWMISIPLFVEEVRTARRPVDQRVLDWTRVGTLATMMVLLYVLSLYEPFRATPDDLLAWKPDGNGLNALLQTDLMVIHPPVVFFAYGFLVLPFAASMAYLITGHKDWIKLSMFWSRIGWLLLTMGIAIGGIWAYTVLGWGGYWGWDPVETSSLLPWLLLTGFLHAQLMNKRKGDYPVLAPIMGVMSFVLIVFATFATRAAGLWVSVHSFGQADTATGAWDRLRELIDGNPTIRIYLAFMIGVTLLLVALVIGTRMRRGRRHEEERYFALEELIDDDMLMFTSITLFTVTTVVTLLILVGGVNGLSADNFNTPVGTLSLIGVLVLLLCLVWRDLGRKRVIQMAGAALLVGLVGAAVFRGDAVLAVSVPILLVGLVGSGYKVVKSFDRIRALPSLTLVGAHLVHLSVVLILIGYVGSTFMQDETVLELLVDGPSQEFGGYEFKATDLDTDPDNYVFTDVEVWKGDRFLEKARPGISVINGQTRAEIKVVKAFGEDVYLVYHNFTGPQETARVNIAVKTLPLMNVLWAGMVLMWVGIAIRMLAEPLAKRRRARTRSTASARLERELELELSVQRREGRGADGEGMGDEEEAVDEEEAAEEEGAADDGERVEDGDGTASGVEKDVSYYEDLLEEELKRM